MSATVPPSPRRLRAARRAGVRPRSPALALAALACGAWWLIERFDARAVTWMRSALTRAIAGPGALPEIDPTWSVALLLGMGVTAGAGIVLLASRVQARRRLGVDPEIGELPAGWTIASRVLGLTILAAWLLPAIAGAARSVDASAAGLWIVWTRRVAAGLLALASVAAGLAALERLASARRLWHGLHLTRAQARDQARAAGELRQR